MKSHAKIAAILLAPILLPPYFQYFHAVPAHLTLTAIIVAYLPLWYYLRKNSELSGK